MSRPGPRRGPAALALACACLALLSWAPSATGWIRGIDVSRFQEKIGWRAVGETRVRFAFVQASRGSGGDCAVVPERCGPDEYYVRNYRRARRAGLRVGAYHRAFADGHDRASVRADALAEARLFVEMVGQLARRDLRPALDVEYPFGDLGPRRLRRWIRTWTESVRTALGAQPIIYTNASSWLATGDTTEFALAGSALWVANWNVSSPQVPARNWAGRGWAVWQYTSSGKVSGIRGAVDRNRLGHRRYRPIRLGPDWIPPDPVG